MPIGQMSTNIHAMVLIFSVKNSHHIKGGGSLTDEDMQEADSNREEICEWEIKNALVTAHGAATGEGELNRLRK